MEKTILKRLIFMQEKKKKKTEKELYIWGFPCSSVCKESACKAGDLGVNPGLGRSPGEGNGNPLQYSCLENPMAEEPSWLQSMGLQESDTTQSLNHHHGKYLPIIFIFQVEVQALRTKLIKIFKYQIFHDWHQNLRHLEPFYLSYLNLISS